MSILLLGLLVPENAFAVKEWTFSSAACTFQRSADVYPGCVNQVMGRFSIVGVQTGGGSPGGTWGLDKITITNTCSDLADLENVKLWWSTDGTLNTCTDELLGTDASSVGATSVFDFADKTGFKAGTWYIFVTYDIKTSVACGSGKTYQVSIAVDDIVLESTVSANCEIVGGGTCLGPSSISTLGTTCAVACPSGTLSAGDIAIIGMNTTDPDEFTFVALATIASGQIIYFTDKGMKSDGSFYCTEGILEWTATSEVTCGTEVTINTGWTSTGGHTVTQISGSFSLALAGDQILAYQGSETCPVFIAALDISGAAGWDADATSAQESAVPTGLSNGTNCVAPAAAQVNGAYDCSTTSGAAAILAAVNNSGNWTMSASTITLPVPCTFTCGACSEPSTAPSNPTYTSITTTTFDINWTATGGPNFLVVVKSGSAVTGTPSDNTTYTANAQFNNGQSTLGAGEYVIYNGTANTINMTGLTCGTTYHVAIFSHDCTAGSEDYKIDASGVSNQVTSACPAGDCFDNIMNGSETAIDCGGTDCPLCDCD